MVLRGIGVLMASLAQLRETMTAIAQPDRLSIHLIEGARQSGRADVERIHHEYREAPHEFEGFLHLVRADGWRP